MAESGSPSLKVVEFYAGIGGFHYALRESGVRGEVAASVDINPNTVKVYSHNFPNTLQLNRNICGLTAGELDKLGANAFFLSPPCQPFTRQGNQLDKKDPRTDSFFHLMHTMKDLHCPPLYLLMENVKGFETSQTRNEFVSILKGLGYSVQEFLLTPSQFGVPNSRLRYFLLAKKSPLKFRLKDGEGEACQKPLENAKELVECVLGKTEESENVLPECEIEHGNDSSLERKLSDLKISETADKASEGPVPDRWTNCRPLSDYLEELSEDRVRHYLVPDSILQRYVLAMDIVSKDSQHSCCFTKAYGNYAVGTGSILQHSLGPEALALAFECVPEAPHPDRITDWLRGLDLRYFTPREVANLMCFPREFGFPGELTDRQCYKCLGNSLNVMVVSVLIRYLVS